MSKRNSKQRRTNPISPNLILDKLRVISIIGEINEEMSKKVIKEIIKLDYLSNKTITIIINSPGGDCTEGLAIVDAMKMCNSPIHTIVTGLSASMGGIISVCGDVRSITPNGFWMAHPMAGGTYDYIKHVEDYLKFMKVLENKMEKILSTHTKLSKTDIKKYTNGQLWLNADQCIEKGVCDRIIDKENYEKRIPLAFQPNKKTKKGKRRKK